jgi:hypothetical protein
MPQFALFIKENLGQEMQSERHIFLVFFPLSFFCPLYETLHSSELGINFKLSFAWGLQEIKSVDDTDIN